MHEDRKLKLESIIFHIPWNINKSRPSASQIRPIKMLEAFKNLGYDVDVVMGNAEMRKTQIDSIKKKIKQGKKYKLVYSESSTYPTIIADGNKQSITHPFLDHRFLRYCKINGIPLGLFYRDIHWRFPAFLKDKFVLKKLALKYLHLFDISFYEKYLNILYLPSIKMKKYLEIKLDIKELPPGCEIQENSEKNLQNTLNIIYIGGIGKQYGIEKLMKVINKNPKSKLVICCRKDNWDANADIYSKYLAPNIEIVHEKGEEIHKLYQDADIASFFMEPNEYLNFAMPMKLFEYIGHHKPTIASNGTAVGEYILRNDIGWTLKYDEKELNDLIDFLCIDKKSILAKISQVEKIAPLNTWEKRA